MIPQEDLTVNQLLDEMKSSQEMLSILQEALILRAELRQITEMQYDMLIELAKEGIEFLSHSHRGDIIGHEWISKRNELIERAQLLVQDAPL